MNTGESLGGEKLAPAGDLLPEVDARALVVARAVELVNGSAQ